ncbi:23S rRNA (pseudouridine(1915)-N(3))-methyltransferase RlmH [Ruminococcaceae bacterium OttesenSCG-928-I18]|nr:23S rRNA (pseudouridine(1915)-N(3))-methyltransferase RlmH [Ruminococcaceae bacterium OttesenSCG-928-I18]
MQKITLLCVGKPADFYAAGIREYEKRLGPLCRFTAKELAEEPLQGKNVSEAQVAAALRREGERILGSLPKKSRLVALCVEGRQMDSEGFEKLLSSCAMEGTGELVFAIGSSHGLSREVKERAERLLSLSAMTLPHQLARLFLTEQIYRAFQIRAGGKYHK